MRSFLLKMISYPQLLYYLVSPRGVERWAIAEYLCLSRTGNPGRGGTGVGHRGAERWALAVYLCLSRTASRKPKWKQLANITLELGENAKRASQKSQDSGLSNQQSRLGSGRDDSIFVPLLCRRKPPSICLLWRVNIHILLLRCKRDWRPYLLYSSENEVTLKASQGVPAKHRGLGESRGTTSWSQNMTASAEIRDTKCRPVWRHSGMPILNDQKQGEGELAPIRKDAFHFDVRMVRRVHQDFLVFQKYTSIGNSV